MCCSPWIWRRSLTGLELTHPARLADQLPAITNGCHHSWIFTWVPGFKFRSSYLWETLLFEPSSQPLSQNHSVALIISGGKPRQLNYTKWRLDTPPLLPWLFSTPSSLSRLDQTPQHSTNMESCKHYRVYLTREC